MKSCPNAARIIPRRSVPVKLQVNYSARWGGEPEASFRADLQVLKSAMGAALGLSLIHI